MRRASAAGNNATSTSMNAMIILLSIVLSALLFCTHLVAAADYAYQLNTSGLPFLSYESVMLVGGSDEQLNLTYGQFLSGPESILLFANGSEAIDVVIDIPAGTAQGEYLSNLSANGIMQKTFLFNITNVTVPPMNDTNTTNTTINTTINTTANITNQTNATNVTINTTVTPFLDVHTDRYSYNLGDIGILTINVSPESAVNITICPNKTGWVQCYPAINNPNQTYPVQLPLKYTNKTGNYTIDAIAKTTNTTLHTILAYTVTNSVGVEIGGDSSIEVDEVTTLLALAAGGIEPYTYTWTLANNTVKQGSSMTLSYATEGTYTEKVSVTDAEGNKAEKIIDVKVRKKYPTTIVVTSNGTGSRIEMAEVKVDDEDVDTYTDSNGEASVLLYKGSYRIQVRKEGYSSHYKYYSLNGSTIHISMMEIPASQLISSSGSDSLSGTGIKGKEYPKINLLTRNNAIFSNGTVMLQFNVDDDNPATCSVLAAKKGDAWYTTIRTIASIEPNITYEAGVSNLDEALYTWKVECGDKSGNKALSEQRSFEVNSSKTAMESIDGGSLTLTGSDSDFVNRMLSEMDKIDGLGLEAKQVAEAINLAGIMQDSIKRLEWANRDFNAVEFRRDLNDEEKEKERVNIQNKMELLKKDTIVSVNVLSSKKYIKYIRDPELEEFLTTYAGLPPERKIPGPALGLRALTEGNKIVQHQMTVSTTAYAVEFATISGERKPYTLLVKDIVLEMSDNLSEKIQSRKVALVEYIPKSIAENFIDDAGDAKNASRYIYGSTYTILDEDPLIEFSLEEQRITYAIPGRLSLNDTEAINTVLYDPAPPRVTNGITGSAIGTFIIGLGPRLYLFGLIIFLILVYVIYVFNLPAHISNFIGGIFKDKQVHYITVLVNDALDYLDADNIDNAELIYREVKLTYEKIGETGKKKVYDFARELCDKLDETYLKSVVNSVTKAMNSGNRDLIIEAVMKLQGTYLRLTHDHKARVYAEVSKVLSEAAPEITLPRPD